MNVDLEQPDERTEDMKKFQQIFCVTENVYGLPITQVRK
jgi:hypothetical protein